ncbi:MAG: hypothetical protein GY737_09250 [Desulfobacteraceae bacterium]|nr:hypothetical protein [Desulfobacteraceae bacterium]
MFGSRSADAKKKMESRLHELVSREVVYDDPLEESLEADVNSNNKEGEEEMKGQSSFQRLMASMKQKANEASRAQTATVESVIEEYLTSKLSNNNLAFWAKYSADGKNCKIKMALSNLAKRYLTPHPTSTNVERLFSTASNVLDGRNLNTESLEKLVFLKENLKLGNFALDW